MFPVPGKHPHSSAGVQRQSVHSVPGVGGQVAHRGHQLGVAVKSAPEQELGDEEVGHLESEVASGHN